MSKLKVSFSFLLMFLLVGMFSAVAFAAGSTVPNYNDQLTKEGSTIQDGKVTTDKGNDNHYNQVDKGNANQTGLGVGGQDANFNQVIKSSGLKQKDGAHTQRTHGEYMNNTNSCASCHQTHTGAAGSLLFKNGAYETCTACHDGTLGFYNVFSTDSSKTDEQGFDNSAGTFGGTHDGNMSAHLANGTVSLSAAPGGNRTGTGSWTDEFTCASCHAPHGSYSDRLLNEDPNEMANTLIEDGGQKVQNAPVVDNTTVVDTVKGTTFTVNTKVASADVTYSSKDADTAKAVGTKSYNYIVYRFKIGDSGAPTNADYAAKGLHVNDTAPWIHDYDFDASHTKHYWTAFQDSTGTDKFDTDQLKKGEILGAGFAGVRLDTTNYPGADTLTTTLGTLKTGKIARGYVVKLDVKPATDSTLANENVKVTTVSSLWASKLTNGLTNPGYVANRGVAMSTWCASCHTDYLANSGKESGTFDHAYRHTTTSDTYTCVRCHYAHGTDVTVMRDARGKTYDQIMGDTTNYFPTLTGDARTAAVKDYLTDKNPSSALKRYTNMAVCWACHTSSHSGGTRNTDSYQYNPTPGVDTDRNGIEFDY
jgi:predicted CXXCH cytochrome family protein